MRHLLLIFVVGIISTGMIFSNNVFAQSSSQSDNCPQGTKAEVKGMDIVCVPISNVKRTCPVGTYQGRDNQGNFACRDIESNNIVDPNTGFMYNSHTGELIQDEKQTKNEKQITNSYWNLPSFVPYAIVGIVILAIVLTAFQKRGPSIDGSWNNPPSMKQLAILRNYGYNGPMPQSSREAWQIIDDLKHGGDGIIEDDEDDYKR
jgi:hypothetical protein